MPSTTMTPGRLGRATAGTLLDGVIALVAFVGSLAQLAHDGIALPPGSYLDSALVGAGNLDPIGVVLTAGSTLPLVAWRRSPLGVFIATAAASALLVGLDYALVLMLGPTAALYLLAASRQPHTPWTRRTTAIVAGLLVAYVGAAAVAEGTAPGSELLHGGLAWAVAWFAGERTRLRREHIADLEERALRAEREADRDRRLAAAEERARIARDLHDSAGHAISVIAVRAGAARLRHHEDPDRSLPALEAIEELARQTAHEIDQIVRGLREGAPPNEAGEAPPGLASLDTLIARQAAAGLDITLDTVGAPPTRGGLTDQASYRILQEALTNAARHGTGSANVELGFGDTAVEFTVTNPVPAQGGARPGGGHGLIGMRERASLLGGTVDAQRSNGTFRVRARIPYDGHRS